MNEETIYNPYNDHNKEITMQGLKKILNKSHYVDKGNGIYQAYLPLKSFNGYSEFEWDALKEIRLKILKGTKVEIGDFQLIEFRGNPKKPTEWKGI